MKGNNGKKNSYNKICLFSVLWKIEMKGAHIYMCYIIYVSVRLLIL